MKNCIHDEGRLGAMDFEFLINLWFLRLMKKFNIVINDNAPRAVP